MARYILVQVEENARADALIAKLQPVAGIRVIGLFARPTKFCECTTEDAYGINAKSFIGPRFGWHLHHPGCGKPKKNMFHMLKNLMDPDDLNNAIQFRDIFFNVKEPYEPPLEKYGADRIEGQVERSAESTRKLERLNNPRVQARREASRQRRRDKKARMRAR